MRLIGLLVYVALGLAALRGKRWAYVTLVILGLLYFAVQVNFRLSPRACEMALDGPLALYSLTKYSHEALFALFFIISAAQFRTADGATLGWASVMTITMGALVELAEGITGSGHCRLRDLVPDTAGAILGAAITSTWAIARQRNGHRPA